jgi:replicative DNA helicase
MKPGIHFAKEIEAAVLGICIMEKHAFGRTYDLIDEKVFYFKDNQEVYQVMREMWNLSLPIDGLTLWERMMEKSIQLSSGNVPWYLSQLTMHVVNSSHLEYHCHLLKKFWQKRELEAITRNGIDPTIDARQHALTINEKLSEILGREIRQDWYSMDQLMFDLLVHQNEIREGKKTFITTGFRAVDRMNGGFSPGQMIVVGARPSVGKSALMGEMAMKMAKGGKTVGIISLEMNNTEIAARLASLDTQTSFGTIYRNLFYDENESRVFYEKVTRKSINLPIYVSDKTKVDVAEIKSKAAKLKHRHGLDILMIDYLQLIDGSSTNKNYNREQEVAKLSRGLKLMAMELEVPVVVLCQLNRSVVHRKWKDRFPMPSDLRESGAIEQDADVILMLHRDSVAGFEKFEDGPREGESTEFTADLLGAKWRNGSPFHLELLFEPSTMKFSEYPSAAFIPFTPQKDREEEQDPF